MPNHTSRVTGLVRLVAVILLGALSAAAWAQDELFVTNAGANSVTVYSRTAGGNTAPVRTLVGAATGLSAPVGVAVDTVNDELIVVNSGNSSVTVFARGASGNTAPLRKLVGAATGLHNPGALAVDTAHDEMIVSNDSFPLSVTVYARTATGNTAPLRTLTGTSTALDGQAGMALDTVNDEIVLSNANAFPAQILVFARTANGDVAPLRTIVGAATGLSRPIGCVVDAVNGEIAVVNFNSNSITVFSRTANGDVAPLRTIVGAATGLNTPNGLALDLVNNELVVTNNNANSVTVYARTATGNAAPLRTLVGLVTGMFIPLYPAVTASAPPRSALVPKSVKLALNTKDATKSTFTVSGFIDTGPDVADLTAAATVTVGSLPFPIASFTLSKGSFRSPAGNGVDVTLTPSKSASSHVAFKIKLTRNFIGDIAPDGPLTLRFQQGAVDATSAFTLAKGRFSLGKVRGSLTAPALYLNALHGVVVGSSKDSIVVNAGLPTLGATPGTKPDVHVTVGSVFSASVTGAQLKLKGADVFTFKGPSGDVTSLVVDYVHGTLSLTAKGVDLGAVADGGQPVLVAVSVGGVSHSELVRLVRSGKSLLY